MKYALAVFIALVLAIMGAALLLPTPVIEKSTIEKDIAKADEVIRELNERLPPLEEKVQKTLSSPAIRDLDAIDKLLNPEK